jgi:hypothetical protein
MEVVAVAPDSPEEVLARLERYVAAVRASREPPLRQELVRVIVRGSAWIWPVLSATAVVTAFASLSPGPALVVASALGTGGVVAMANGVRFSTAWTLGVVVGALLVAAS